jgi:hypothetical protein
MVLSVNCVCHYYYGEALHVLIHLSVSCSTFLNIEIIDNLIEIGI